MTEAQALSWLLAGTPFAGAVLLGATVRWQVAGWINVGLAAASLALAAGLAAVLPSPGAEPAPTPDTMLRADALAAFAALLTTLVGLSIAWHGKGCLAADIALRRLPTSGARLFQAGFQFVQGCVLLALLARGPGLAWLGMLAAALALALMTALPGTRTAVAAARRALLLAAAALALAFLGTATLLLAAQPDAGADGSWIGLTGRSGGPLPRLGFVLALAGYGALAGLAPVASWLPGTGTGTAGSAGVPAILSTGLRTAALLMLLRFRAALGQDLSSGGLAGGAGVMALVGFASVLVAAVLLWHRPGQADAGRWLSVAGAMPAGAAALAFALGGPAVAAGLAYLAAATLAHTGAAQCLGRAGLRSGGTEFDALAGLHDVGRGLGVLMLLCLAALAGLLPTGVFTGQVLIFMEAARRAPVLGAALAAASLVAGWALLAGGARLTFGPSSPDAVAAPSGARQPGPPPGRWDLAGVWVHLLVLTMLGLLLPAPVAAFIREAAASVAGAR